MATIYSLVCENGSSGSYWSGLSATDRLRYGAAGSERVYSGLMAWRTARYSACLPHDIEVCEIGDAFTETLTAILNLDMPCASQQITTNINGQMSVGFHGGSLSAGFELYTNTSLYEHMIIMTSPRSLVNGIRLTTNRYYANGIRLLGDFNRVENCILSGNNNTGASQQLIRVSGVACNVQNNIILESARDGLLLDAYICQSSSVINNISAKNARNGFLSGTNAYGYAYNNISIGNATANWGLAPSNANGLGFNFGETGDTPWDDGGATSGFLATTDFSDYANNNFYPALATSPQVNTGVIPYLATANDISNAVRPNYEPTTYPDEKWDVGPFEYDHGYGLAPKTVTLEITNIVVGSELAIYKASDNSVIVAPQTIAGTSYSTSYTYTADTLVNIVLRNASGVTKYQPYKTQGNITANGLSVYVSQVEDAIAQ